MYQKIKFSLLSRFTVIPNLSSDFVQITTKLNTTCIFFSLGLRQDNTRVAGSPTCLKVSTSGACEDLDMETEEEEDVRARGLNTTQ